MKQMIFFMTLLFSLPPLYAFKIEVEKGTYHKIILLSPDKKPVKGFVVVEDKKSRHTEVNVPRQLATEGEFTHAFGEKSSTTIYAYADGYQPQKVKKSKVKKNVTIILKPNRQNPRYALAYNGIGLVGFNPHGFNEFKSVIKNQKKKIWELSPKMDKVSLTSGKTKDQITVKEGSKFLMTKEASTYSFTVLKSFGEDYLVMSYTEEEKGK